MMGFISKLLLKILPPAFVFLFVANAATGYGVPSQIGYFVGAAAAFGVLTVSIRL